MALTEPLPEPSNPLGVDGIEFIEYATSQAQAFGALLERMGFSAVARHRSREVVLYRQGGMNLIVNSELPPGSGALDKAPTLAAVALRVRDAGQAFERSLDLGAWEIPTRAAAMELHIPGIHGVGDSLIYFVDRYRDFSIYDVDFVFQRHTDPNPPALAGLHWFGVVQSILPGRTADWLDFYRSLLGFEVLPRGQYFGVLPKGAEEVHWEEDLVRVGLGAPDVRAAVRALQERGVVFVDHGAVQPSDKGALTQVYLGGVTFELVVSHLQP
jgi:4-hydroxyphenylpyruvate dioxygenase